MTNVAVPELPPIPEGKVGKRKRRRAGKRIARRKALKNGKQAQFSDVITTPVKCAVHAFILRYQSALRKVPAHLPPRIHAGPPSKRVKRVSWREDETPARSSGSGDPAVLLIGPTGKRLVYTRDDLMRLRNSPLSKRPLDSALLALDVMSHLLKKRAETPNDEDKGGRGDAPSENQNQKGVFGRDRERRSADPRERVRKESEPTAGGIVLSPQRRSFTSGCGAPNLARTRPDSPPQIMTASKPDQARRIGSGRIMVRDVAAWERGEEPAEPLPSFRNNRDRNDDRTNNRTNGDRYERRSFTRDSFSSDIKREREERFNNEKMRDREDNRRSGGRFTQRRFEKEDEPEWFSGGPTSRLETIELRGFDEPTKKTSNNNKDNDKWNNNNNGSRSPGLERWRNEANAASPSPPSQSDMADTSNDKDSGVEMPRAGDDPSNNSDHQPDFNLEEFLKFDSIPDVLTNGGAESEGGSRFSRWFHRESPTNDMHSFERFSNMVDGNHRIVDLEQPRAEPSMGMAGHNMFAPISPAQPQPVSLMELLHRANNERDAPMMELPPASKIHSLEELEARLRPPVSPRPERDLVAFKRLLAQVSGGHAVPAEPPRQQQQHQQPMTLLQMLNKSVEQQKQAQQQQSHNIPQDLLYKLLHLQQRQQHQPEMPTPPSGDRELLQRPEAQAIIHGLKAGEITPQHLFQQLNNPGLQSRHRDLLLAVLRLHHHNQQMGSSPLPSGVQPPHLVVPPHQQQLRLSPLPHPGVPSRIPSPRELVVHTQSIMQGALIKKKLEEQRENCRRRHEMQTKQPTPISFTPTSVLRKMTAEKESDSPSPKQPQWAQPPKMPQGRPIVKGNQSGGPAMNYSPAEYQQHYLGQQPGNMRQYRPMPPMANMGGMGGMANMGLGSVTRGVPAGTTLHQLLVQSHQRSMNEGGPSGGGDNQLARWFSPELLARASAGKLPSVHMPNALSLEELERAHHSPAVRN